jgi:SAM-dependent methyltransferase
MNHRFDVEFYDEYYARNVYQDPTMHTHAFLHQHVLLEYLDKDEKFVDLGCGDGAFIIYAITQGYSPVLGIDFSATALRQALHHVMLLGFRGYKRVGFIQEDLLKFPFGSDHPITKTIPPDATFTALEVLEHLPDDGDLILLNRLKETGQRIIFSVPSVDSEAHARFFKSKAEVQLRYKPSRVIEFSYQNIIYFIGIVDKR